MNLAMSHSPDGFIPSKTIGRGQGWMCRLERVRAGNFGDSSSVGEGVFELRLHFGAGYRIYYGRWGDEIVVLLCGGSKRTQKRDIPRAKQYWEDYKRNQNL